MAVGKKAQEELIARRCDGKPVPRVSSSYDTGKSVHLLMLDILVSGWPEIRANTPRVTSTVSSEFDSPLAIPRLIRLRFTVPRRDMLTWPFGFLEMLNRYVQLQQAFVRYDKTLPCRGRLKARLPIEQLMASPDSGARRLGGWSEMALKNFL